MMTALLQQELGDEFRVEGAGTNPEAAGSPANPHSVVCMEERGIDLSTHVSRWVGALDLNQYTHIVCVGEVEAQQVLSFLGPDSKVVVTIANKENGGVPNPYQLGLDAYRDCLTLLDQIIPEIAKTIR
jgi:protein-tyrosine-phosphatase